MYNFIFIFELFYEKNLYELDEEEWVNVATPIVKCQMNAQFLSQWGGRIRPAVSPSSPILTLALVSILRSTKSFPLSINL